MNKTEMKSRLKDFLQQVKECKKHYESNEFRELLDDIEEKADELQSAMMNFPVEINGFYYDEIMEQMLVAVTETEEFVNLYSEFEDLKAELEEEVENMSESKRESWIESFGDIELIDGTMESLNNSEWEDLDEMCAWLDDICDIIKSMV